MNNKADEKIQKRAMRNLPRWNYQLDKKNCIIVDLDGTLSELGDRSPYSHVGIIHDTPRVHTVFTVNALITTYKWLDVFFITGRNEKGRNESEEWIKTYLGDEFNYQLFMRDPSDWRKDCIYKREVYEKHIEPTHNVMVVFEDRPQVIRECWRPLGIPVFNCGVIDEEF